MLTEGLKMNGRTLSYLFIGLIPVIRQHLMHCKLHIYPDQTAPNFRFYDKCDRRKNVILGSQVSYQEVVLN